ncbi:MAG: response regulator [Thermoguttaceae bacterium]
MKSFKRGQPLVLIIDDEQAILDQIGLTLAGLGVSVECCATAEAALAAAATLVPDLILCDTSLPDISGVELCEQMRQNPLFADVPVMFLSGAQGPDIIRRSDGVRGTYYLRKPLDQGVLVDLIGKALGADGLLAAAKGV